MAHPSLIYKCWRLNPGLHPCQASNLPTELHPQTSHRNKKQTPQSPCHLSDFWKYTFSSIKPETPLCLLNLSSPVGATLEKNKCLSQWHFPIQLIDPPPQNNNNAWTSECLIISSFLFALSLTSQLPCWWQVGHRDVSCNPQFLRGRAGKRWDSASAKVWGCLSCVSLAHVGEETVEWAGPVPLQRSYVMKHI